MRIVYNRIGKAGSSFMFGLLLKLSWIHHFQLVNDGNSYPSKQRLSEILVQLPDDAVYVNHANLVLGARKEFAWINVVREPIDRWQSLFYYGVDEQLRGQKAIKELERRAMDKRCGCANLEFDACIRVKFANNCSLMVPSQIDYFCEPEENCTAQQAFERVKDQYILVGLNEEMRETVLALEHLLPRFFRFATNTTDTQTHTRSTHTENPLTGSKMNGCISSTARGMIASQSINYSAEKWFYDHVKRLFWSKVTTWSNV